MARPFPGLTPPIGIGGTKSRTSPSAHKKRNRAFRWYGGRLGVVFLRLTVSSQPPPSPPPPPYVPVVGGGVYGLPVRLNGSRAGAVTGEVSCIGWGERDSRKASAAD
ncbi:hypothetical protein ZHAS_00014883 [Anopheles sinensis]|uniref:Uncharacterized protein n=1 Tax=Anopheles sinensis TaxID=74873 RepID=A0A084W9I4_ANOSI|nr:hypothetical protein ZHAS_00014883 [Anopheles sinensis]